MCVCLQKEIRSSLVLSMLQQMLAEDKADMVREAVVKSLGIIMGYIDDPDKYSQVCATFAFQHNSVFFKVFTVILLVFSCLCVLYFVYDCEQGFELMLLSLGDPSERVVSATHQVFIPAFAAWCTELGNLQSQLIPSLLTRIEKLLKVKISTHTKLHPF